ncbi:MAG: hypothetical protein EHM58_05295 [Ignavibacteriae bacterium]|nr:MAG: hypothetical protein EHM58_05295 [Ignavibacteriota bacterium]
MALLSSRDLKYTYSWTAYEGDNPKISGEPDNTLLNRNEGYEMLYFINKFAEIHNFINKESGHKVEELIKTKVPSHIHSQIKIKDWLVQNWNN